MTTPCTEKTHQPRDDFRQLLQRVRGGSQEAARELVELYAPHVLRAVRQRLHESIRPKFDSIDFVQSVWVSFFAAAGRLDEFTEPEQLLAFLVRMAYHKVIDEIRRRILSEKFGVGCETSLNDPDLQIAQRVPSGDPTPSEAAVRDELWDHLTQGWHERYREVLELRRGGHSIQEIADRLGVSRRTIERMIDRVVRGPGGTRRRGASP